MTEEIKKEEFSLNLFSAFAAKAGYKSIRPRVDDGIDLMVNPSRKLVLDTAEAQKAPSSNFLGIQMKTTTFKQIKRDDAHFRYYLKKKNFNDLVAFKNDWYSSDVFGIPLVLVVHVLPDKENDWVEINREQHFYKVNGLFYWYFPERETGFSQNPFQRPILIENQNLIGLDFFNNIFNLFFQ